MTYSILFAFLTVGISLIGMLNDGVAGWRARGRSNWDSYEILLCYLFRAGARISALICFLFILWEKFS